MCEEDKNRPVVFIHIPKTGGTYITQNTLASTAVVRPIVTHGHNAIIDRPVYGSEKWSDRETPEWYSSARCFSVVRNPYSLLVSYYLMRRRDCEAGKGSGNHHDGLLPFSEFLHQIADEKERRWAHIAGGFMFYQLFKTSGTLAVQYIARQETLDEDLKEVAGLWDLTYYPGGHMWQTSHYDRPYTDFYSSSMRDLVAKRWHRELKMFGYGFSGIQHDPMLSRQISKNDTKLWSYDYENDSLLYEGSRL